MFRNDDLTQEITVTLEEAQTWANYLSCTMAVLADLTVLPASEWKLGDPLIVETVNPKGHTHERGRAFDTQ